MIELIDIVNENDQIIGVSSREDIYSQKLFFRGVFVMVFNSSGKLALQIRGFQEKFLPGYWFSSVGGHVQSGETYEIAAIREMKEELGIDPNIKFVGKFLFQGIYDKGVKKFLAVYEAHYDGELNRDKQEADDVQFLSLTEIQEKINNGGKFQPELLYILNNYYF